MESLQIYKDFLLRINKNDTNAGISIPKAHFVLMFNVEAIRWLGDQLDDNGDNIKLDHLDTLLESDILIPQVEKKDDWYTFEIAENFYRHVSSYAIVDKGECKGRKIFYFEKKPLGITAVLADDFSRASFDYEEAPFIITQRKIKAYVDDYIIKKYFVSYYREPTPIDIEGYTRFDGTPSTNVNCELDNHSIDEILDRVVLEATSQYRDMEGVNLAQNRIQSEP